MHRLVGKGIAWLGGLILLSAVAVNPWIGTYYQDYIENYADVMLNYLWWSLGLAALLVAQRYNVDALVRSPPDDPRFDAGQS